RARVFHHQLIELRTKHLPGLSYGITIVAIEEIKRLRGFAIRRDKLDAVFFDERGLLHLLDKPESLDREKREGNQRFTNMVAREFFTLENNDSVAVFGEEGAGGRTGWAGANDQNVTFSLGGHKSEVWLWGERSANRPGSQHM